jgi:stearoyl-CoA desaturase (delta-9 desaturase)
MAVIESLKTVLNSDERFKYLPAKNHETPTVVRYDIERGLPFYFFHLSCLWVLAVGANWAVVGVAFALYYIRMFAITGFYHRYFSHKAFKTNRFWQFVFAVWGMTSAQKGPLWWAAHHRHHHAYSDKPNDLHSVREQGFLWAHIGWICTNDHMATDYDRIKDYAKYPELMFLNQYDWVVPAVFGLSMIGLSLLVNQAWPTVFTHPMQFFIWGFFVSTVMLYHGTFSINSLSHVFGKKRYTTTDDSKNNWFLSIVTMGEGWHNNHHYFPSCVRQGFYWWEWDPTYYILKAFSWVGIIWDLNPVPQKAYNKALHTGEAKA